MVCIYVLVCFGTFAFKGSVFEKMLNNKLRLDPRSPQKVLSPAQWRGIFLPFAGLEAELYLTLVRGEGVTCGVSFFGGGVVPIGILWFY